MTIGVPTTVMPVAACADRAAPPIEIALDGAVVRASDGADAQQSRIVWRELRA
ncbi:MAG: hypothetical protein ACLGIT_10440 [Gammaproteobacteria bacterium]|uniref:hypothetical protein n=1 Tax=Azohydromonas sp. TaxID=1872666 RepID=UPI002C56F638|nr:hypothetical protein [Azohydromonas sp.]HMM85321.1 hypothetical protein [Azohydromonas sp.]